MAQSALAEVPYDRAGPGILALQPVNDNDKAAADLGRLADRLPERRVAG